MDDALAVLVDLEEGLGLGVDQLTDFEVGRLDRNTRDVIDDPHALAPHRVAVSVREWAEVAQQEDGREEERSNRRDQAVADERTTSDA